jgi:hypothetical protein
MFRSRFPLSSLGTSLLQSVSLTGHLTHLTQHRRMLSLMTRGDRTNITMADLTFTAKQQTALLVLWPCLKAPPRIDVPIGPEGIRFGATFDKTAPGTILETVRSDYDQIAIAINLDVATVEVDFEKLKAAADLGSVDEAVEVWESIKDVVSAASCTYHRPWIQKCPGA